MKLRELSKRKFQTPEPPMIKMDAVVKGEVEKLLDVNYGQRRRKNQSIRFGVHSTPNAQAVKLLRANVTFALPRPALFVL